MADDPAPQVQINVETTTHEPSSPSHAPPLQTVHVTPSEPPAEPHRRVADAKLTSRRQIAMAFKFVFAIVVEHWRGISQTRLLSIGLAYAIFELAHDWLHTISVIVIHTQNPSVAPGWAFVAFVIGGFFVSAVLALGAKYIDKVITIVAAKFGVILANAPAPTITGSST